jgi:hypothetical protein
VPMHDHGEPANEQVTHLPSLERTEDPELLHLRELSTRRAPLLEASRRAHVFLHAYR